MKKYNRQNGPFKKSGVTLECIRFALMFGLVVTAKKSASDKNFIIDKSHIKILDEEIRTSKSTHQYKIPFQALDLCLSKILSKKYKLEVDNTIEAISRGWEMMSPKLKIPAIQANHNWIDKHGISFSVFELHTGSVRNTKLMQTQHFIVESLTSNPWM